MSASEMIAEDPIAAAASDPMTLARVLALREDASRGDGRRTIVYDAEIFLGGVTAAAAEAAAGWCWRAAREAQRSEAACDRVRAVWVCAAEATGMQDVLDDQLALTRAVGAALRRLARAWR